MKNQGACGSCWAFSAAGALEGLYSTLHNQSISLSAQALVDCANNGNSGCAGGQIDLAFQWVAQNGIPCEKSYPYKGMFSHCYNFQSMLKISGFVDVPANNTE